jgi:hypothetical protein
MLKPSEVFAKPDVKKAVVEMRDALRRALPEASFGAREAQALLITNEAVRGLLEEDLQTLADNLGGEILVNGALYKCHEPGSGTYHSLCGPLEVRRPSHRQAGVRNGPTVIAVELAAGLVEGATPALAFNVAHGYAHPWRDARSSASDTAVAHDARAHRQGHR